MNGAQLEGNDLSRVIVPATEASSRAMALILGVKMSNGRIENAFVTAAPPAAREAGRSRRSLRRRFAAGVAVVYAMSVVSTAWAAAPTEALHVLSTDADHM